MLKAIFATDEDLGFGYKGRLPWPKMKDDMRHFMDVTCNGVIFMAKSTWKTLPKLPNRLPVLVTDNPVDNPGVIQINRATFLSHVIDFDKFHSEKYNKDCTIIGGTSLFTPEYLKSCDEIYYTVIKGKFEADVKFPQETIDYLNTLEYEVIKSTDKLEIRKYATVS